MTDEQKTEKLDELERRITDMSKMIMPPEKPGCFYPDPQDLELAAKSLEFAAEILRRHTCYGYWKGGESPPDPPFVPMTRATQVDVGEDTEKTVE